VNATPVRRALREDYPALREFLEREWSSNHVFVKNSEIFFWQHLDRETGLLNFLLFESEHTIRAVLGFIPYSLFSSNVPENRVFLAIWKTSSTNTTPGAGFHLYNQLHKHVDASFIGAIGISEVALPLYQKLGYTTGVMDHFIVFNPGILQRILTSAPDQMLPHSTVTSVEVDLTADREYVDMICLRNASPKNAEYLVNRFAEHPTYHYLSVVFSSGERSVMLVMREVNVSGSLLGRVVDAVGEYALIADCAAALREVAVEREWEYVDIYSTGLSTVSMNAGGYFVRGIGSDVVVPNYFEPFVQTNVDISFAWKNQGGPGNTVLFRGDSDQDRPNS
jgi:hypothetical protein